jgi:hypothetical protein
VNVDEWRDEVQIDKIPKTEEDMEEIVKEVEKSTDTSTITIMSMSTTY